MVIARVNILGQLGLPLWAQGVVLAVLGGVIALTEWEDDRDARQLIRTRLARRNAFDVTIRRDWSTLRRPLVYDVRFLAPSGERMYNRCTVDPSVEYVVHWHEPIEPRRSPAD